MLTWNYIIKIQGLLVAAVTSRQNLTEGRFMLCLFLEVLIHWNEKAQERVVSYRGGKRNLGLNYTLYTATHRDLHSFYSLLESANS